jgi:hypothetical protein
MGGAECVAAAHGRRRRRGVVARACGVVLTGRVGRGAERLRCGGQGGSLQWRGYGEVRGRDQGHGLRKESSRGCGLSVVGRGLR